MTGIAVPEPQLSGDDLAYATLDYIREHPEEWNQADYFCGTTACFAGRAMLLAFGSLAAFRAYQVQHGFFQTGETAEQVLGWTPTEAYSVFQYFTKDFGDLEARVKRVLNGELRG